MTISFIKSERGIFFSNITSISLSEVRIPSPVIECLLKIICPDCSPPIECPFASYFHKHIYPLQLFVRIFMPCSSKALYSPIFDITVVTIVII